MTGITVGATALAAGLASAGPEIGATKLLPTIGLMRLPPVIGLIKFAGMAGICAAWVSEITSTSPAACWVALDVVVLAPGAFGAEA